jgi:hypothetical protein
MRFPDLRLARLLLSLIGINTHPGATQMSTASNTAKTDELPRDLIELTAVVATLDESTRSKVEPLLRKVLESTRRRRKILNLVQEALSQLRLDMKYLVFDLEATRRERDAIQGEEE